MEYVLEVVDGEREGILVRNNIYLDNFVLDRRGLDDEDVVRRRINMNVYVTKRHGPPFSWSMETLSRGTSMGTMSD